MIDALASEVHYRQHIEPVWEALPARLRGTFHTRPNRLPPGNPTIVASYSDLIKVKSRSAIYMEHGAGQTYRPGHSAYAGGRGREHVGLFLNPSERVAELNRAAYPNAEHAVVGCPLLDRWIGHRPSNPEPIVALAFHVDLGSVAHEARSAFRHYADVLPTLPYRLLGHGHPRAIKRLSRFYDQHGIEWTADYSEVLRRADVLVFDNTSAGFMFAALDRPVVVLDCPSYKKAWGGRFFDWADVGVRISEPEQLAGAIAEALADSPQQAQRRADIVSDIYAHLDGTAAQRASEAVMTFVGEMAVAA